MQVEEIVLFVLLGALLLLNLGSSWALARSSRYSRRQKQLQFALIWLLPMVGALLVWALAKDRPGDRLTTDLSGCDGNGDGYIRHDDYSSDHAHSDVQDGD